MPETSDFHGLFEQLTDAQQVALFPDLLELKGKGGGGNEARLKRWWLTSAGIDWGNGGDFDKCVRMASEIFGKHGVAIDPKRWCAALHKEATGASPGHAPGERAASKAKESGDTMPNLVIETVDISEAAAKEAKKSGKMLVQFISPGWGSSGYYSPQCLKEAAQERVIPKGTHMYADHPTDAEAIERPGRSVKDLMAVTLEDAKVNADGALVGQVQVVPAWQPLVETVAPNIGVSIRGDAKDITMGEAEGRSGRIIEGLAHVASVDFVTRAGRGGKVLQILESAAANQAAIDRGFSEATVNDTRDALQDLLSDAYGGQNTYVYVRDFDDATVWFQVSSNGQSQTFGQPYTGDSGSLALSGQRSEVRQVTSYVPAKTGATEELLEGKYDADQMQAMVKKGHAMKNADGDPSYPIADVADLKKAIKAVGRGGADHASIRAHIKKRAKALGQTDLIPDTWESAQTLNDVIDQLLTAKPLAEGSFVADAVTTWINEATAAAGISLNVPVSPAGQPPTQGDTMGNIQIEESEHQALLEKAGRVPTLESERDTAVAERDQARRDIAARDRRDAAVKIIGEAAQTAGVQFAPLEVKGLLAELPVKEGTEELNSEAFTKTATEEAAKVAEARGAGRITGFGGDSGGAAADVSEDDFSKIMADAFGHDVKGA